MTINKSASTLLPRIVINGNGGDAVAGALTAEVDNNRTDAATRIVEEWIIKSGQWAQIAQSRALSCRQYWLLDD
jgi:hypothetical protein